MRVISLASGSKGNCIAIESEIGNLLIDCGIGIRTLNDRAKSVGFDLNALKGILITHEHGDHICGLDKFSKYFNTPVYIHPRSYGNMNIDGLNYAGNNDNYELGFDIGGYAIRPFRSPHDSSYCVGYRVEFEDKSVTLATDLGFVTGGAMSMMRDSDAVILESNHNTEMLKKCRYPMYLKQRIMSNSGHLSNMTASDTVKQLAGQGVRNFMLAHLSENSNTPEQAKCECLAALSKSGADKNEINLSIALQHEVTQMIIK